MTVENDPNQPGIVENALVFFGAIAAVPILVALTMWERVFQAKHDLPIAPTKPPTK